MSLKIESSGAFIYGSLVTLTEYLDTKRIKEAKLRQKDVLKRYAFWTYMVIGLFASLNSIFGWFRKYEGWTDPIANGFLYDLTRQGYSLYQSMKTATTSGSAAIAEANRIVKENAARAALKAGRETDRSYEPEYNKVGVV